MTDSFNELNISGGVGVGTKGGTAGGDPEGLGVVWGVRLIELPLIPIASPP
jgi:hypothetical protein